MHTVATFRATAGLLLALIRLFLRRFIVLLLLFLEMSRRREILELGVFGRVPLDTLFELHIETRRGDVLTICQTKCQASIGGWVRKL